MVHGKSLLVIEKKYISALAVNLPKASHVYYDKADIELPMRLQLIHNPYAYCSLDKSLFIDPEDEHYEMVDDEWINGITGERLLNM